MASINCDSDFFDALNELINRMDESGKMTHLKEIIEDGDVQANVNDMLDFLLSKRNVEDKTYQLVYAMHYHWLIRNYCVKDNFKLWQGYIAHRINTEKDKTMLNKLVNNQYELNKFLVDNGRMGEKELTDLFLKMKMDDLITYDRVSKSTEIFELNIKKLFIKKDIEPLENEFEDYFIEGIEKKQDLINYLMRVFPTGKNSEAAIMVIALQECKIFHVPDKLPELLRALSIKWDYFSDYEKNQRNYYAAFTKKYSQLRKIRESHNRKKEEYKGNVITAINKIKYFLDGNVEKDKQDV